ncbi:MAG: xanthine dehydrogenase family protein molybdopterin-binding subunit, partial [Streptosporangiaceae bacterium]
MTAVTERPEAEIGKRRTRKEDQHLITGRSTFVDNMTLPGMVHLAILRSPLAHATITSIDASPARERPGVIAAFTGQDFADSQGNLPCAWPVTPDMVNPGYPSLAVTQVNFAGEAVAVVAARTRAQAQDALEAIEVDYDPLPPVIDLEAALADGAPLVHPNTTSNKCYTWSFES